MHRRNRLLIFVLGALIAGGVTAGIVLASSGSGGDDQTATASGGAHFSPAKIKGKWTGSWNNITFNTHGSIRANVQVKNNGNLLVPLVDFGGTVFGCSDPPAALVSMPRGGGNNHWNNSGFKVSKFTQAFGKLNLTYDWTHKSFKGTGARPPCNPNITYTVNGTLTKSRFTATVKIILGPQTATSKLTAHKQ
jgi:hypothetical protein